MEDAQCTAARKVPSLSLIVRDLQVVCGSHQTRCRTQCNHKYNIHSRRCSYTSARVTTMHSCLFKVFSHCFACVFIKRCVSIRHSFHCDPCSLFATMVSNRLWGTQTIGKANRQCNYWVFSICAKVVHQTDHVLRAPALRKVKRTHTTRLYRARKGAPHIKMAASVTLREAYWLSNLINSLDRPILAPSTKCVFKIAVRHNELA